MHFKAWISCLEMLLRKPAAKREANKNLRIIAFELILETKNQNQISFYKDKLP